MWDRTALMKEIALFSKHTSCWFLHFYAELGIISIGYLVRIIIHNKNRQIDHMSNIITKLQRLLFQTTGETENVPEFEFERI